MGEFFTDATGQVFELGIYPEGSVLRELHDRKLASGELRPLADGEQPRIVTTVLDTLPDGTKIEATTLVLEAVAEFNDEVEDERDVLLAQARDLGLDPHHRTGVPKLRAMIDEATAPEPADGVPADTDPDPEDVRAAESMAGRDVAAPEPEVEEAEAEVAPEVDEKS